MFGTAPAWTSFPSMCQTGSIPPLSRHHRVAPVTAKNPLEDALFHAYLNLQSTSLTKIAVKKAKQNSICGLLCICQSLKPRVVALEGTSAARKGRIPRFHRLKSASPHTSPTPASDGLKSVMANPNDFKPGKFIRRTAPAVIAFLLTGTLSRRARIPKPLALLTSTLTATLASIATGDSKEKAPSTDWLDAIQAIGKIITTFSEGLDGISPNIFLDASLQRMLHDHHSTRSKDAARLCPKTEHELLLAARTYLDFALAPYGFILLKVFGVIDPQYNFLLEGTRGIDVAKYMLRLNHFDVIIHQLDGECIGFPRYFAAVHHPTSTVVVSIRGTNSVSDVITDLLCGNENFCNGYAHSGMLSAAREIFTDCVSAVNKAVTETGYRVVVTGHSLGAGVGVLLTKLLLLKGLNTECFAFAPPPVFGPKHAIDTRWSDAVKAFVNEDDLVSRLCFASAKYLAREMDALAGVGDGYAKRSLLEAGDAVLVLDAVEELPSMEHAKGFEALSQTARVVRWLLPNGERAKGNFNDLPPAYVPSKRYECFNVPSELFDEILVTASCVSKHMVSSYTGSFSGLSLPKREKLPPPLREDFGRMWYSNELG